MLVGLPYSGKSEYAKSQRDGWGCSIHSSDAIRGALFGDVSWQNDNPKVFEIMNARTVADLSAGISVVYDATNLSYKKRMNVLQHLNKVDCEKICILMATPFEECIERGANRERKIPMDVLQKMYRSIWIPHYYEGWDDIQIYYAFDSKKNFKDLFDIDAPNGLWALEQDTPYHDLTVGWHCYKTWEYIAKARPEDYVLQAAALYHDIGKRETKQFLDSKGNPTDVAHYYGHEHVSAYEMLFYLMPTPFVGKKSTNDLLDVAALIQWHMRPFYIEKAPDQGMASNKFKKLVGEEMYEKIMLLHEADIKARKDI